MSALEFLSQLIDIFHLPFVVHGFYILECFKKIKFIKLENPIPDVTDEKCIENVEETKYETAAESITTNEED